MPVSPPTMRAIIQDGYGAPPQVLTLGEIQVPSIGPDDVLVHVRAASVNTPDWSTVAECTYILRLGFRTAPAEAPGPGQRRRWRRGGCWPASHRPGARRRSARVHRAKAGTFAE